MQLRNDLERIFVAWLLRLAFKIGRLGRILYRRPKLRTTFFLTLYTIWHAYVIHVLAEFRRAGLIKSPERMRKIGAYIDRVGSTISRRNAAILALTENG